MSLHGSEQSCSLQRGFDRFVHIRTFRLRYGVSGYEKQIIALGNFELRQAISLPHKALSPVSFYTSPNFFACYECIAIIRKSIFFVQQNDILASGRFSAFIQSIKILFFSEYIAVSHYTVRDFLPLSLLLFRTFLPFLVAILLRKPCSFFLWSFLG